MILINMKKQNKKSTIDPVQLDILISGVMADPFSILGAHHLTYEGRRVTAVRAFLPGSQKVIVTDLDPKGEIKAEPVNDKGVFEAILENEIDIRPYHLKVDFIGVN